MTHGRPPATAAPGEVTPRPPGRQREEGRQGELAGQDCSERMQKFTLRILAGTHIYEAETTCDLGECNLLPGLVCPSCCRAFSPGYTITLPERPMGQIVASLLSWVLLLSLLPTEPEKEHRQNNGMASGIFCTIDITLRLEKLIWSMLQEVEICSLLGAKCFGDGGIFFLYSYTYRSLQARKESPAMLTAFALPSRRASP
ncbi:PREDICTED: uncharacterized protein LOC106902296 [Calidris pugnax]|uniref:uncharacterized protein LOC106902296 n=1 Tax=Calidris pugnax TaxID=198806 RepID=UPI00071E3C00|nr:PREDICTED: uncharacterized protein LOC106902296 [Calidris pugnax]